jgi:hypothetical protein
LSLCVKEKVSTTYVVPGLGYGERVCACLPPARNASQREAGGSRAQASPPAKPARLA